MGQSYGNGKYGAEASPDSIASIETSVSGETARAETAESALASEITQMVISPNAGAELPATKGVAINLVVFSTTELGDNQVLDSFPAATVCLVRYSMLIASGGSRQVTEIALFQDANSSYDLEYADADNGNGELASFSTQLDGNGNIQLLVTPVNANTTFTASRTVVNATS